MGFLLWSDHTAGDRGASAFHRRLSRKPSSGSPCRVVNMKPWSFQRPRAARRSRRRDYMTAREIVERVHVLGHIGQR
jgi:hypothetical protein